MTRATARSVPAAAALALVVLVTLSPTGAAAEGTNTDPRLPDCTDLNCIAQAFLGGIVRIFGSIFIGLASIGTALLGGFADLVIKPFLGIFGGFFGGLGTSLANLAGAIFGDVGGAFREAYFQLSSSLRFTGPAAPLVATGVVLGVLAMIGYAIVLMFDRANDILPGPLERLVDTDDEDDDDDDEDAEKKPGFFARIVGR